MTMKKVDKVFDCIMCAEIAITEMERLGQYQQTRTATRLLKVTMAVFEQRWRVLRNSKKLKEAGGAFRKVYVKKTWTLCPEKNFQGYMMWSKAKSLSPNTPVRR